MTKNLRELSLGHTDERLIGPSGTTTTYLQLPLEGKVVFYTVSERSKRSGGPVVKVYGEFVSEVKDPNKEKVYIRTIEDKVQKENIESVLGKYGRVYFS